MENSVISNKDVNVNAENGNIQSTSNQNNSTIGNKQNITSNNNNPRNSSKHGVNKSNWKQGNKYNSGNGSVNKAALCEEQTESVLIDSKKNENKSTPLSSAIKSNKKHQYKSKTKTMAHSNSSVACVPNRNKNYSDDGYLSRDEAVFGLDESTAKKKKGNLNHLLNFKYESARDMHDNYYEYEKFTKQFWSMKLSKNSYFSKEQFLQANCQFVVKDTEDYKKHMNDPDILVEWDKIEEIHIDTHEPISCPICLYEPIAGKMTKCGHIYCWSCILHYLSLSDKSWRKCPICFESIYKNDLKSVRVIKRSNDYKVGDEIELNLMFKCKSKYNTLSLPFTCFEQFLIDEKKMTFNLLDSSSYSSHSQYFKLHCRDDMQIFNTVIQRERNELSRQLEAEKNQPEICFVNEALVLLDQREQMLNRKTVSKDKNGSIMKNQQVPLLVNNTKRIEESQESKYVFEDAFEDVLIEKKNEFVSNDDDLIKTSKETNQVEQTPILTNNNNNNNNDNDSDRNRTNSSSNCNDYTYFYQAKDGQRIYINSLNSRCLISEYNSLPQCPLTLKARIIATDSFFMDEENRKRYKYLSHLPLHSEFKLVELDLKETGLISKKTLDLFEQEIEERKKFRERKEQREKRNADRAAAAAANHELNKPHYYVPSAMNEIITSNNSQTDYLVDYSSEFPEASTSPISSGISVGESTSSGSSNSSTASNEQQIKSFAQMLNSKQNGSINNISGNDNKTTPILNNNQSILWPSLSTNSANKNSSIINSSNQLTNGWLTMASKQTQPVLGRTRKYQDAPSPWITNTTPKLTSNMEATTDRNLNNLNEEDNDDAIPVPLYQESFFSAIDESLKMIESKKFQCINDQFSKDQTTNSDAHPIIDNKMKKKKKTKQLLFSNSLNMGL